MDASRIRFGLIGVGAIGCEHSRNLALLKGCACLVAVADTSATSRQRHKDLVEAIGLDKPRVYEDYRVREGSRAVSFHGEVPTPVAPPDTSGR